MAKLSDIDLTPQGQQEAINEIAGVIENDQPNEKWFVVENGDGWEISFGSSNSVNGCVLVGPDAKEYAYLIARLNNEKT
ncbi:hypothetical protein LCGC14_1643350 [marine sediment metagenome]|uniref:Uncharacterized protein n=1 Tax=marine sediment metagenome TaxID=412755 RepID=A0A0F9KEU7_9ZZZZ